jgi:cation diffusion facilitator family transporter
MDIKQKASLSAIVSAAVLAACKFSVGVLSGSMAVISSGLDSLLDVFMSAMNLVAIKNAAKPADQSHQYGHGKVEDLAALVQSSVIILTGGAIIYTAVQKFLKRGTIAYSSFDLPVMLLSLVFSFFISRVLVKVGEKTHSNALKADALHYTSDLYSNSAAIAAIILTFFTGNMLFDLLFAVITGCIIVVSALKILKNGISGLLDSSIPEETEEEIESILDNISYPFAGYHKLRTRLSGSKTHIDFHLLVCRKLHMDEAHELANKIEHDITVRIFEVDIVTHLEPCEYTCDLTMATCPAEKRRAERLSSRSGSGNASSPS